MDKKWVVTYGLSGDNDIPNYAYKCDLLEDRLKEELKKYNFETEYLEDFRDGETYTVRFSISKRLNVPRKIVLKEMDNEFSFDLLEFSPESYIYPDDLHLLLDKYMEELDKIPVPFFSISYSLILQIMSSLENKIYDAVVVLCRSLIDSSLILSCSYSRTIGNDGNIQFDFVLPINFKGKDKMLKKMINWSNIVKVAKNQFPALAAEYDSINTKVRELGNFAAHLGEKQIRKAIELSEGNKKDLKKLVNERMKGENIDVQSITGIKQGTSFEEAEFAFRETIFFLINLIRCYNASYVTR